jgi:excisionase family DNA binding protein
MVDQMQVPNKCNVAPSPALNETATHPLLLNVSKAAAYLGLDRHYVARLIKERQLIAVWPDGRHQPLVPRVECERYVQRLEEEARADAR